MGRPRKDNINVQSAIINLAKMGMTNVAIAKALGISRPALQKWFANTMLGETIRATRQSVVMLEAEQKYRLNKAAIIAAKKLIKEQKVEEVEERRDKDNNLIYSQRKIKKVLPSASMVQFILERTDPHDWNLQNFSEAHTAESAMEAENEIRIIIDDDTQQ